MTVNAPKFSCCTFLSRSNQPVYLLLRAGILLLISLGTASAVTLSAPVHEAAVLISQRNTTVPEAIVLKAEQVLFTPTEFYIAEVTDERADKNAIAWLQVEAAIRAVDLEGGGLVALKQFMLKSLPQNNLLRPLLIRVHDCKITESMGADGKVEGRVALALSFDLQRGSETVYLMDYAGGVRYTRSPGQFAVLAPALSRTLEKALHYLNDWMNTEAPQNKLLARGVRIHFSEVQESTAADTVFYAPERPLVLEDFTGKPTKGNDYAASIFPGFSYKGSSEIVDGLLEVKLQMKVYVLKEYSWVREEGRTAYTLNHEQRHFDLAKIVAERFKKKVTSGTYPVEDYAGLIAYQYIEYFREMTKLQQQYDDETSHGLDQISQERWNQRINAELQQFSGGK